MTARLFADDILFYQRLLKAQPRAIASRRWGTTRWGKG